METRITVSDFAEAVAFSLELKNNSAAASGKELYISIPRGAETDDIMFAIADGLAHNKTVEKIQIGLCLVFSRGSQALFAALEKNTTLQELGIYCSDDGAAALGQALASNTSLRKLCVEGRAVRELGSRSIGLALLTNTTLQRLEMRNNNWGEAGGDALEQALAHNTSLKALNMQNCIFRSSAMRDVFEGVKRNSGLLELSISENIGNLFSARQDDGGRHIGDALASNGTLKFLQHFHPQLGPRGSTAVAEGLGANTSLQVLRILGDHTLGDAGAEALGRAMSINTTLKVLTLSSCSIGSRGVAGLVDGLRANRTLEDLGIGNNKVGEGGAEALKQALMDNALSVRLIDLTVCGLGAREMTCIAEGLGVNTTLDELKMCSNDWIGVEGVEAIAGALEKNARLHTLDMNNCINCSGGLTAISRSLRVNSTLRFLDMAGEEAEELNNIKFGNEGAITTATTKITTISIKIINVVTIFCLVVPLTICSGYVCVLVRT
jgi:Ran GTPase-activating protein (RanGAP) involved in mRNA processing and transport